MVAISNVGNKYIAAIESVFGTTPSPFTSVDLGHIQKISVKEEENVSKMSSINSGHLASIFEDGLYWANVTIETKCSKASLPVLLKFMLGARSDATDYAATTSPVNNSLSLKFFYQTTKCGLLNGLVCKDWELNAAKGETVTVTLNCIAQKLSKTTETLSVSTNTDTMFSWLDTSITIGATAYVLNNFTMIGNWNVTDDEGRGIEASTTGTRRLITTVLKHRLDLSGSYEAEVSDSQEFGYADERTDQAIVVSLSRGADNVHDFTMTKTRSFSRGIEMTTENTKKVISYDYEAVDVAVAGDL